MKYKQNIIRGVLLRRYKRFLADVELEDGTVLTVHTPNTGAMLGCAEPGSKVWLYESDNPKRKYPWSWFLVENDQATKIGINTSVANRLVEEAINNGVITELQGYQKCRREVKSASGESRFDLFLEGHPQRPDCFVEVKSVTAVDGEGVAIFPDAVSTRGTKHLVDLQGMIKLGYRGCLVFCVQREDVHAIRAAVEIDPDYAAALHEAASHGVEILAYVADISPEKIELVRPLSVLL